MQLIETYSPKDAREQLVPASEFVSIPTNLEKVKYDGAGQWIANESDKFFLQRGSGAEEKIFSFMGLKPDTFGECSEPLRKSLVDELLNTNDVNVDILIDGKTRRTSHLLDPDYPFINPVELFDTVMDVLGEDDPKIQIDGSRKHGCVLNFITKESAKVANQRGDIINSGIVAMNRIGRMRSQIEIGPFAHVLQCTNGQIGTIDRVEIVKERNKEKIIATVRELVRQSHEFSKETFMPVFARTVNHSINNPAQLVHTVSHRREFNLGDRVRRDVMDNLPALGDTPTIYDMIYLMTSMANEYHLDDRINLQRMSGYVIEKSECHCPTCKRAL